MIEAVAFLPFDVWAVIVAAPASTAVTLPLEFIVATDVLLLVQVIVLSVALSGVIVAVNGVLLEPLSILTALLFNEILVGAILAVTLPVAISMTSFILTLLSLLTSATFVSVVKPDGLVLLIM